MSRRPFQTMLVFAWCLAALAPVSAWSDSATPADNPPPAGIYHLDPVHGRLMAGVSHLGFSEYSIFFKTVTADLVFDPAAPEKMSIVARIDPKSVETLYPDPTLNFNAVISGESFLDAEAFPEIVFKSTKVHVTGPGTAAVTGDLTLHGVTRPVTLHVRYNGGYAGDPLDPGGARIGFSAEGALFRSDFGIDFGIPAPGSQLGIGDLVSITLETEFLNPDVSGIQVGP